VGLGLIVWLGVYLHIAWVLAKKPTKKCHASRLMGCFSAVHTLLFGRAHFTFRPCTLGFSAVNLFERLLLILLGCLHDICFSAVHTLLFGRAHFTNICTNICINICTNCGTHICTFLPTILGA
jgi:hypothetical protein